MSSELIPIQDLKEKGYEPGYAAYCDHTVLRAYTTSDIVRDFCEEAKQYGAAAVCVNPVHVALVKQCLEGTGDVYKRQVPTRVPSLSTVMESDRSKISGILWEI